MRIAIDAMGGDHAPREIVAGAVEAVQTYQYEVVLVGDEQKIKAELTQYLEWEKLAISVQHASEVIEMQEHPATAVRKKKDSSIVVATRLVKEGLCDVVISAGSTGAATAAAIFGLGRITGIERPTIATPIPNTLGTTILLDSGAIVDSQPKNLVQSAIMGSIYAEYVLGIQTPRVGLLSIGEEENKGNELVINTFPLLKRLTTINFIGNVEGMDIPQGTVDVVVCDGFVGNVVLKFGEGLARAFFTLIKDAIKDSGLFVKLASMLVLPAFKNLKKKLDDSEYGGAPLLGVNGGAIICHGKSKAKAIKSAVKVAGEFTEKKVIEHIRENLATEGIAENEM